MATLAAFTQNSMVSGPPALGQLLGELIRQGSSTGTR